MPIWIAKNQLRIRSRQLTGVILSASLMVVVAGSGQKAEADSSSRQVLLQTTTDTPARSNSDTIPSERVYFADILVRGQPVFQVGSLSDLSAGARAAIVNRRIKSVLAQPEVGGAVTVELDLQRGIALLKQPGFDDCYWAGCPR